MEILAAQSDLSIVADFGHRLFTGKTIEAIDYFKSSLALMVQTNSSNFGFNLASRHKRHDYLCLDLKEARLLLHDRESSPAQIRKKIPRYGPKVSLTLGPNGSFYGDLKCPAFTDQVVDAIGAGDAYFAITSCLWKTECPDVLVPFIGNVFAGLKTKIIGNKAPVTKASLQKALSAILK